MKLGLANFRNCYTSCHLKINFAIMKISTNNQIYKYGYDYKFPFNIYISIMYMYDEKQTQHEIQDANFSILICRLLVTYTMYHYSIKGILFPTSLYNMKFAKLCAL